MNQVTKKEVVRVIASLLLLTCSLVLQVDAAAKLIYVPLTAATTQGAGSYGQPVMNYYANLQVGTPVKPFNVQFDIGLAEQFVPHYSMNPFKTSLHYGRGFQCKVSSSCVRQNRESMLDYQHCKLTGKSYEDQISFALARTNGVPVPVVWRQTFVAMGDASDSRFSPLPVDGFFGLNPGGTSLSGSPNILVALLHAAKVDNLQFSLWFNPMLDQSNGGELVLGGMDTSRFQGKIYWHKINPSTLTDWQLNLQSISLGQQMFASVEETNGNNINGGPQYSARLSSSLSDIYGPNKTVKDIYKLLNTSAESSGLAFVDCRRLASLPRLKFVIDGIPYELLPSNYIRKMTKGTIFKEEACYVAILPSNDNIWTLGTNFLGAYYTTFDMTQRMVGFAMLR